MSRSKEGHSTSKFRSATVLGLIPLAVALLFLAGSRMQKNTVDAAHSAVVPVIHIQPSTPPPPPPSTPTTTATPSETPPAAPEPTYSYTPPATHSQPPQHSYTPPAPVMPKTAIQQYARSLVADSNQYTCIANIIQRESGWDPHAGNADGSYGVPQSLPGNKMASEGSDWRDNPETQLRWMVKYIRSRYGSPCGAWAFWQGHSWY